MNSRSFILFFFIVSAGSACMGFGNNKSNRGKKNKPAWVIEKRNHEGAGLTDSELKSIAHVADEVHFNRMLDNILVVRVPDTPGSTKVRNFIQSEMDKLGWTVELDQFQSNTPIGRKSFTNIVSTLNSTTKRRLVLACHYDSLITPKNFLGAIDSAVPCAMLINLAHTLQQPLNAHKLTNAAVTLQFIFFDGEEAFKRWSNSDSLYGARNLAAKWDNTLFPQGNNDNTKELDRIDLFVLLDLLGTADNSFVSLYRDSEPWYARLLSFEQRLTKLNKLQSRKKKLFNSRKMYNSGIEDDHVPFLKRGVPILHLISVPFPSVWHKISDNRDALDAPTISNLNIIFRTFVADYLHLSL